MADPCRVGVVVVAVEIDDRRGGIGAIARRQPDVDRAVRTVEAEVLAGPYREHERMRRIERHGDLVRLVGDSAAEPPQRRRGEPQDEHPALHAAIVAYGHVTAESCCSYAMCGPRMFGPGTPYITPTSTHSAARRRSRIK